MTWRPLSQLQRAVIVKLSARGLVELAMQAREAWVKGEPAPLSYMDISHGKNETVPEDLRDDYAIANSHARE